MLRWLERWALKRAGKQEAETLLAIQSMTAKIENGLSSYEAEMGGPAATMFAAMMIEWFKRTGGVNYVTCAVQDRRTGARYEITMQRCGGKTPADVIAELKANQPNGESDVREA